LNLAGFARPRTEAGWDVAAMRCTNIDRLNQYVHHRYRKGWEG
jgi:hypothetical protein